jgi:hypothetical protein
MPITTAGGAGTVTGTRAANTNPSGITLFTTPNTANAVFIVNYTAAAGAGSVNNLGVAGDDIFGFVNGSSASSASVSKGSLRVGPNTQIKVADIGGSSGAYHIEYNYLSVVIS